MAVVLALSGMGAKFQREAPITELMRKFCSQFAAAVTTCGAAAGTGSHVLLFCLFICLLFVLLYRIYILFSDIASTYCQSVVPVPSLLCT